MQEKRREVGSFNTRIEELNNFSIKVMHACSITLCVLHEKISRTKPKIAKEFKDTFLFLKEEWTITMLSKWLGGNLYS